MIKAALLLYRATRSSRVPRLGRRARTPRSARTSSIRQLPLYSVYVFDDGQRCTQVPHRFFASVNGDMIWSGFQLARVTGERRYLDEALATARAVDRLLADPAGVFADLQAENDIVEPLVEAMFVLANERSAVRAPLDPEERGRSAVGAQAPTGRSAASSTGRRRSR